MLLHHWRLNETKDHSGPADWRRQNIRKLSDHKKMSVGTDSRGRSGRFEYVAAEDDGPEFDSFVEVT